MRVVMHAAAGPRGPVGLAAGHVPLAGPLDPTPYALSGDAGLLADAGAGLPEGPARAEAIAVRLRARGIELAWGEPVAMGADELLARTRELGRGAVAVLRADPSLLTGVRAGG